MEVLNEETAEAVTEVIPEFIETVRMVKGSFAALGVVAGAAAGAAIGYFVAYKRLETKYNQIAENEIDEMRKHFRAKLVARDEKPSLSELAKQHQQIVDDQEYKSINTAPMAVAPPQAIVDESDIAVSEEEVEAPSEPEVRNVFQENQVDDDWDYHHERSRRSPRRPYVIHVDERDESVYSETTFTYYEGDDVLCNEKDEIVDPEDRERLIGEKSLEQFGHGSKDAHIVYVRNDDLEIDFEVVRSPQSYAEEVHGLKHHVDRGNLERMRTRERREHFDDD